jgi:hypothetical protein
MRLHVVSLVAFLTLHALPAQSGSDLRIDPMKVWVHASLANLVDETNMQFWFDLGTELVAEIQDPGDITCETEFEFVELEFFGGVGDDLAVVDTSAKFDALMEVGPGAILIPDLRYCGEYQESYLGCAPYYSDRFVFEYQPSSIPFADWRMGALIGHERGHNAGLPHRSGPYLMTDDSTTGRATINEYECNEFRAKGFPDGTSVSFSGEFVEDDDVVFIEFSVSEEVNPIAVKSFGYEGGFSRSMGEIADGGLDPQLTLFDASGAVVYENDRDCHDRTTGETICIGPDARVDTYVPAGTYRVALTQAGNAWDTTTKAFEEAGQTTFTSAYGCSNHKFCSKFDHSNRTPDWAVEVFNIDSARIVPEPGSPASVLAALLTLSSLARRRKSRSSVF